MVGLGTLIGFIPAEKAISIKPIEALKRSIKGFKPPSNLSLQVLLNSLAKYFYLIKQFVI